MPRIFRHPLDKNRRLIVHFDTQNIHPDALTRLSVAVGRGGGDVTDDRTRADILVVDPLHPRAFHEFIESRRSEDRPPVVFGFWISLCMLLNTLVWLDHPHWEHVASSYEQKLSSGVLAYGSFLAGRKSATDVPKAQLQSKASEYVAAMILDAAKSTGLATPGTVTSEVPNIESVVSVASDDEASLSQPPDTPALATVNPGSALARSTEEPSSILASSSPNTHDLSNANHREGWSNPVTPSTPITFSVPNVKRTGSGLKLSTIGSSNLTLQPSPGHSISRKMKSKRRPNSGSNDIDRAPDTIPEVSNLQSGKETASLEDSSMVAPQNGHATIDDQQTPNTHGTAVQSAPPVNGKVQPNHARPSLAEPASNGTQSTQKIVPIPEQQQNPTAAHSVQEVAPPPSPRRQESESTPSLATVDLNFPRPSLSSVDPASYVLATLDAQSRPDSRISVNSAPPVQPKTPQRTVGNTDLSTGQVPNTSIPKSSFYPLRPVSTAPNGSVSSQPLSKKEIFKARSQIGSLSATNQASTSHSHSKQGTLASPAPRPSNGLSVAASRAPSPPISEYSDQDSEYTGPRSRSDSPTAARHAWLAADPPASPYPPRPVLEPGVEPIVEPWEWSEEEDQYIIDFMNWWFERWPDASTDAILSQIAPKLWHHSRGSVFTRFKNKEQKDYMMQVPVLFHRMTNRTSRVNPAGVRSSTSHSGRVFGLNNVRTQTRKRPSIDYRESSDGEGRFRRTRDDSDEEPFRERRRSGRTTGHKRPRYTA